MYYGALFEAAIWCIETLYLVRGWYLVTLMT